MTQIVLAPEGRLFESPASWLSRVALSQGATLKELLRLLPVNSLDLDLESTRPEFRAACTSLGLDLSQLVVANRVFGNLHRARLDPHRFLLFEGKSPRYRFCPSCLAGPGMPMIPVHWRFTGWRVCPLHACLMREACAECGTRLALPSSMLDAGPDREGVAYLSMCLACGARLSRAPSQSIADIGLHHWEMDLLRNGRAVLAALYYGEVLMAAEGHRHSVSHLAELERRGLLPNKPEFLSQERIDERLMLAAA